MLEWRMAEGWEDGSADQPTPQQPDSPRHWRRWLFWLALAGAFMGAWVMWQAPLRYQRLVADIQATVDLELWAWQNRDALLFETLLDPNASTAWRQQHIQEFRLFPQRTRLARRGTPQVKVESVEPQGDLALVTLRIRVPDFPTGPLDYTQSVPYRLVEGRWARTAPDTRLWGPTHRLTTPHFTFVYAEHDAATVRAIAAELEAFYAHLRDDLALSATGGDGWTIILTLDPPLAPPRPGPVNIIRLNSPTLALLPRGITPIRHLKLALGRELGERLIRDETWTNPLSGVAVWNLPVAVVEWNTVRWAEGDTPIPPDPVRVPRRWQGLIQTFDSVPPVVSILDYVAAAYGRPAIPRMVSLAREGAHTWEQVAPRALGVDRATFESGWLRYAEAEADGFSPPPS